MPAAQSLRKTIGAPEGEAREAGGEYSAARELAAYRRRAEEVWPKIDVTDVDSTGLPDTPVLGSKLTLTATVHLAGLSPDEVAVQAVLGRVDAGDVLLDPVTVEMSHTGTAEGGNEIFSTTTPLPLAGALGYTVRVLPRHPMLVGQQRARPGHSGLTSCHLSGASLSGASLVRSRAQSLQRPAYLRGVGGLPERRQ